MGKGVIRFYDPDGENGYLSNWYRADFRYAGRSYSSVEQYMMMQKALTFGDSEIAEQIQASDDLREIKRLGHMVARYNDSLWKAIRVQILRRGIRAKFQQNPRLLCDLLATGNALLAECAPRDLVWGIGIDIEDSRSGDPKEWKGRNLLGRTLMRVREDLRAWAAVAGSSVTAYEDAVDLRAPRPVKPSRRSDGSEAERIRRELMQSFGEEAEGGFGEDAAKNGPDIPAGVDGADQGVKDSANADTKSESSVWNMHIYEACMLPYLSEIVSTWLEEVLFNLRRSRSYEDLGVSNYTFEELEWMLRSGQSAGLPKAGFFEMKQDIFDMMRYQGGLRNPAALLAQVDIQETLEEPELPDSEIADLAEHQPDEHITVAFRPHGDGTMIATIDPGTTSAPETYVTYLPATAGGEPAAYAQEAGEEAKTSIGSTPVDSRPAAELWNDIRKLAGGDDEPEPVEDNIIDELNRPETYAETTPAPAVPAEETPAEKPKAKPVEKAESAETKPAQKPEVKAEAVAEKPAQQPEVKAEVVAEKPTQKPAAKAEAVAEKPKAKDVLPEEKKAPAEEKKAVAEAVKVAAETAAETPKKAEEAPKQKPGRSAAEASILKRTQHAAKPADDLDGRQDPEEGRGSTEGSKEACGSPEGSSYGGREEAGAEEGSPEGNGRDRGSRDCTGRGCRSETCGEACGKTGREACGRAEEDVSRRGSERDCHQARKYRGDVLRRHRQCDQQYTARWTGHRQHHFARGRTGTSPGVRGAAGLRCGTREDIARIPVEGGICHPHGGTEVLRGRDRSGLPHHVLRKLPEPCDEIRPAFGGVPADLHGILRVSASGGDDGCQPHGAGLDAQTSGVRHQGHLRECG